ncbi:hypothetical protein ElyMa_001964700 [Elysia marginata]|uniref:Uncharacterized protein n=1 Tax=Elysia marginata TaxID=1093978 RepID=A0AAV4EYW4_9GAST|nr:hypothetical protein ElyMa_001964700 [Elysia marginata]
MELDVVDDEPAWKDAARFATKIWRHPKTHSVIFICCCTCALTAAALHSGTYYTPTADVIVYCLIYSLWLTICLPWLVKNLDKKALVLVVGVLFRLFAAEAGVLLWGLLRGHGYFLQRALRLKPLLEPSLLWLAEAGYNLRYGVVVSACVAATLATLTTAIENFSRREHSKDHLLVDAEGRKDKTTQARPEMVNQNGCPFIAVRQGESPSPSSGRTFCADGSATSVCCSGQQKSPEPSPAVYGISSLLSFSSPEWNRKTSRRDKNSAMRSSMGDSATVGVQDNWPQAVDRSCRNKGQYDECWEGSDSSVSAHNNEQSSVKELEKKNQDLSGDFLRTDPRKANSRGFSPVAVNNIVLNRRPGLPNSTNADSPPAAKSKPKVRPSSSYASSVSTELEMGKLSRLGRGQRSGRSSCPTEIKSNPLRKRLIREKMSRPGSRAQAFHPGHGTKTGGDRHTDKDIVA